MAFNPYRKGGQFHSKQDARSRADRSYICTSCLHSQAASFDPCPGCKAPGTAQYCMSHAEKSRAAELILATRTGRITNLRFQPRYALVVEGDKVTTYVADFEYREGGKVVVEDVKPGGTDFMEDVAKLKIALFNALHKKLGITVTITRR